MGFNPLIFNEFTGFLQAPREVMMLLLMRYLTLIWELVEMLLSFSLPSCLIFLPFLAIRVKQECSALNSTSHKHFTFITSLQDGR